MTFYQTADLDPAVVVIFGASGDLTERNLIPALFSLACDGLIPPSVQVLGIARSEISRSDFHQKIYEGLFQYGRLKPKIRKHWEPFAENLDYFAGAYDGDDTYQRLKDRLDYFDQECGTRGNRLFYFAVPPKIYPQIVERLGRTGLNRGTPGWTRIIVEKPFGSNLKSAAQLNAKIHAYFRENQVYRIDHYLGKETVQNLLAFRFANAIFEPLWNRNFVDHVQISVLESVGVEHRAGYYDNAGVVRDMFQNHLLQLLSLTAMEPPVAFNAKSLRDEKVKVLQSIRSAEVADGVWGQYRRYRDEPGVARNSKTPTYLGLRLYLDSWRWQGVPFYLRSGKALATKSTEITLQFKRVPHLLFRDNEQVSPNLLSICIQPDEGMHLRFETKIPGAGMRTDPVEMDFHYSDKYGRQHLPDAYERLLLDALQGDASLFARSDEIEQAWSVLDPLLAKWDAMASPPLVFYETDTWGPSDANSFMAVDNRAWYHGCGTHMEAD